MRPFDEPLVAAIVLSEPLRERLDDQVVDVAPALRRARVELSLQLGGHAQQHGAPVPRSFPGPPARLERDGEPGREDADGDVVEVAAGAAGLLRQEPLQLAGHPDEHVAAVVC